MSAGGRPSVALAAKRVGAIRSHPDEEIVTAAVFGVSERSRASVAERAPLDILLGAPPTSRCKATLTALPEGYRPHRLSRLRQVCGVRPPGGCVEAVPTWMSESASAASLCGHSAKRVTAGLRVLVVPRRMVVVGRSPNGDD